MSDRKKPYTTNQQTWHNILQKPLQIPMNQREYSWGPDEINKFIDDIISIFEEGEYVEKMGSIINLSHDNKNFIYDGQQRILTIILTLHSLGCISTKLEPKIKILLSVDDLDVLTPHQTKLKDEEHVEIIPKITCINPHDMKALTDIFNNKVKSYLDYVDNLTDLNELDDDIPYTCKICKTVIAKRKNFMTHIANHDYKSSPVNSKLYPAFIHIYNKLVIKQFGSLEQQQRIIDLFRFILDDIDIQFYECTDPNYVSKIFDWENNRGRQVESFDLIKNPLIVQIEDDKKMEVYEKWETLKHKKNPIYKNFGQRIFDVAIQLYNGKISRKLDKETAFKPIIYNKNTYTELNKFFTIVEELFDIMDQITKDKFGRIVNNIPRICFNWEAYMWCLLPIAHIIKKIDHKLIHLLSNCYFRNQGFKIQTFTKLPYAEAFILITNKLLSDNTIDYYKEIKTCLDNNIRPEISSAEEYIRGLSNLTFSATNATHLLLFLETCENTDECVVPLTYSLEHICPQKDKQTFNNKDLINNLGNLTLFEKKNSINGHKGNSSLGCKPYTKKVSAYKGSGAKITRYIADKYSQFTEQAIIERSKHLAELLNTYTQYSL